MKLISALLLLVVLAGLTAFLWPVSTGQPVPHKAVVEVTKRPEPPIASIPSTTIAPAKKEQPAKPPAITTASPAANPSTSSTASPPANPSIVAPRAAKSISPDSLKVGLDRAIKGATIVPGNILKQPDGTILADNQFLISGEGTQENPYRVTWECLTSASQTFIPRLQQHQIPQRVAMLDGKWIRIQGYLAFPLMLQESSEILAMLNQWDGCCIGVPPTPYDAIEVKLETPVKPGRRHTYNFGTVTGKFKVDPYLVENWLVGLYQLESASVQADM